MLAIPSMLITAGVTILAVIFYIVTAIRVGRMREKHNIAGICLSGYGMDRDVAQTREAGFAEHLVKPVDLSTLKSVIENVTT